MARTSSRLPKRPLPADFLRMMEEAGFKSSHELASAAGNPDMLRDLQRKGHTLRADSLIALSAVLKRRPEEVSAALRLPMPPGVHTLPHFGTAVLPVRHVVQAGAWLEVEDVAQAPTFGPPVVADPSYPRAAQWLELVRGDSMDRIFPEGTWVHAVDAGVIGYAPRAGNIVVVERGRRDLIERSLKQIGKTPSGDVELWPRSNNPKWSAPLEVSDTEKGEDGWMRIAALVIGGYMRTP